MRILSVNVALPIVDMSSGVAVRTAIRKHAVTDGAEVQPPGLEGDGRAEKPRFRGEDHAVSALASEHYAYWAKTHEIPPPAYGSYGENLTTLGALEGSVRIGEVWRCGTAVLQVAQPRIPCRKWRDRLQLRSTRPLLESRRLGFYLRVLEPGRIPAQAEIEVMSADSSSPTVDDFIRLTQIDYWDAQGLERLLRARDLMDAWREIIEQKLERTQQAPGWHGFRPLEVCGRLEKESSLQLALRCPEGRPLAPFTPGQVLMLSVHGHAEEGSLRQAFPLLGQTEQSQCYQIAVPAPGRDSGLCRWLWLHGAEGSLVRANAPRG